MTDTERWVDQSCERIMASGHVRLYRDLYRDLRQTLPCEEACRLIAAGLGATRYSYLPVGGAERWRTMADRARAIAALTRLRSWVRGCEAAECPRCGRPVEPSPYPWGACWGCFRGIKGDGA